VKVGIKSGVTEQLWKIMAWSKSKGRGRHGGFGPVGNLMEHGEAGGGKAAEEVRGQGNRRGGR
jgi:hypothetical protein